MNTVAIDPGAAPEYGRPKWRKRAFLLARLFITAALLYFLFRQIDFHIVLERFSAVRPSFLAVGVLMIAIQSVVVMATRWALVLEALGVPQPWRRLTHIMIISLFFNETLPSTVGGDAVRAMMLNRDGLPLGATVQSIAVERAMGLTSLLFFALFGSISLLPAANDTLPLFAIMVLTAGALIGTFIVVVVARMSLVLPRWLSFCQRPYDAVTSATAALAGNRRRLALMIGLSLIGQLLVFATLWMVTLALNIQVAPWHVLAIMPSVILTTILPISVAGWGLREGAMVLGLGLVGVAAADAIAISLLFGFKFAVFGLLAGIVWLFSRSQR